MYIAYKDHRFTPAAARTVEQALGIIDELSGYTLTLRQLYYQFVSKGLIENAEREYKRLGRIVTDARESGLMSWYAIEDRGRNATEFVIETDPREVLNGVEYGLAYDPWAAMDTYVEVWVEKQALEGVIARPCRRWRVPYMACKGYLSASEAWRAGRRFREHLAAGDRCVMIHLGDHDPSGIDMTRDNHKRLWTFAEDEVEVRRVALNMDQVEEYDPPPAPAKILDSRAPQYIEAYGHNSWELDALPPAVLNSLISDTVEEYIDRDTWDSTIEEEREARRVLAALPEYWSDVERLLQEKIGYD